MIGDHVASETALFDTDHVCTEEVARDRGYASDLPAMPPNRSLGCGGVSLGGRWVPQASACLAARSAAWLSAAPTMTMGGPKPSHSPASPVRESMSGGCIRLRA
jgi:hypothetical protein